MFELYSKYIRRNKQMEGFMEVETRELQPAKEIQDMTTTVTVSP